MKILLIFLLCSCVIKSNKISKNNNFDPKIYPSVAVGSKQDEVVIFNVDDVFKNYELVKTHTIVRMDGRNSTVNLEADSKRFTYLPFPKFSGTDIVRVYWQNKFSHALATSELKINLQNLPDAPSVFDDFVSTQNIVNKTVDVLQNDIDVDGDSLTIQSVDDHPDIQTEIVNGKVRLTIDPSFSDSTEANISYVVRDTTGLRSTGLIRINQDFEKLSSLLIPLQIVFVNKSTGKLSNNVAGDAQKVLTQLNLKMKNSEETAFFKFKLEDTIEVVDDFVHVHCDPTLNSCNDFGNIIEKYGKNRVVTLVFVANIQGDVAGIAKLNRVPHSKDSTVVAEYKSINDSDGTIYTHEIGHMIGLDHTQRIGAEKNEWITFSSCGLDTLYFQRGLSSGSGSSPFVDNRGVTWDDIDNTMKPFVSGADEGYFTQGYRDIFPKIFSCYRARAF